MAIDIKNLVELIQKKEHGVDSNTSMQDMLDILKAAQKAEGAVVRSYDSDGALPDAVTSYERIAYMKDTKTLKFNNGAWDDPLLGAAAGPVTATSLRGTAFGFRAGGFGPTNIIDKYSLTADGNATDVGDLAVQMTETAGANSLTDGYTMGGEGGSPASNKDHIQKYSLSTDGNATDVANLTAAKRLGQPSQSTTHGYLHGGYVSGRINNIDKFEFATDGNATDVGDMTGNVIRGAGLSSDTHGYRGGGDVPGVSNIIDKFPFASDANATDVGDLTVSRSSLAGLNSETHGYAAGGNPGAGQNVIDKWPFATDENATDVGDLVHNTTYIENGKSNSTTHGYTTGGVYTPGPSARLNEIQKFSFSVDENATDVGDLTNVTQSSSGAQV